MRTFPAWTALVALGVLSACSGPSSRPMAGNPPVPSRSPSGADTSSAPAGAQDLEVTPTVRARLVRAAADAKGGLPAADFKGLASGQTYYAFDPATRTYWAGAALVPRSTSRAAAVSVQDNGSYDVFERPSGGAWRAFEVGLAGVGGTTCPVDVPAAVLRAFGWPLGSCHPSRGPGGAG